MIRRRIRPLALALAAALPLVACARGSSQPTPGAGAPTPVPEVAATSATPAQVDSIWNEAMARFRRGKYADARAHFERFLLEAAPGDERLVPARFHVAESKLNQGEMLEAARDFRRLADEQPGHELAPTALLRVGDAYAELWRRPELDPSYGQTALTTYQELAGRYPGSEAAGRAQLKVAALNDWFAVKQYKAALYYLRLKAYDSAILYLKDLVATYPRADVADEALLKLVEAYRELGYQEDATETCGYLRRFHGSAEGLADACPAAAPAGAPAGAPAAPPAAPDSGAGAG
jgi:outer membrane protein assembly factor BamD